MPLPAAPPVAPGTYPGPGQSPLLRANEQQYLFRQQLITAGQSAGAAGVNVSASIAVQLERIKALSYPFGASLEVSFTDVNGNASTPGNFEVDWQNADTDRDAAYNTVSALVNTASLNASFVGRIELPTMWAKYTRIYVKTLANPVYITAVLTR